MTSRARNEAAILIIEDEALIAMDLENLVENLGHRTTGIARSRTEACRAAGFEKQI